MSQIQLQFTLISYGKGVKVREAEKTGVGRKAASKSAVPENRGKKICLTNYTKQNIL